jgi:small subunit ribosomal protein S20
MPSHKSAAKRVRQTVKKNAQNRARRSKVLTLTKLVDAAIASKDQKATATALRDAVSGIAKATQKGTIHWKTAARKTSRLAKRAKAAALKKAKA